MIVVIVVSREASMDKSLFNSTLPVIITDLQQASSQFRASQTAARQAKSTPMASFQVAAAKGPHPMRGPPDPSSSQDSRALASSSSPEPDADPEIQLENGDGVE